MDPYQRPAVPGSMSFDCQTNWGIFSGCIRAALTDARISADQIAAVSSTSMREGIGLYDRASHEFWACANVDGRAMQEVGDLKRQDDEIELAFYAMRWFRDTFCQSEMAKAALRGADPYTLLEQAAAQVQPGANGIIPIFSDAMDFGRWYHAPRPS